MVDIKKTEDLELWQAESEVSEENDKVLQQFKKRYEVMKKAKSEVESEFRYADKTMYAKPTIWPNWQIIPHMTMEYALIETYQWSKQAWLPIEVATEWRPNWILAEMARQTLQHFIRIEEIENNINIEADFAKAKYWTCCLFSWLDVDSRFIAEKWNNDYIAEKKSKLRKVSQYHITIKNIDPRNVWFDDVPKFKDAEDCIWRETISVNEFKTRFYEADWKPVKWYVNVDHVAPYDYPTDWKEQTREDVVQLYHYFNKIMWYYRIIANENVVIYNGYANTQHWELPIIPIQHYYNDSRIRWDGIPKRYAVVKWINSNLITDIIWWARLNAWWLLVQWSAVSTEWEIYLEPWEIQIVEMTEWNARDIQPINMQVNVWQLRDILTLMDDYWIILTWLNFKAPYTSPAKTAFETSVMQEEQNNRLKTPAQLRDIWLSRAFNIMLCNIFQFAPYLYVERLRDQETWKSTPKDMYYIPLKWKKIHWKDSQPYENVDVSEKTIDDVIELEDVDWYEDYFAMSNKFYDTDKLLNSWQWLKVYIKTASTPATMKALEIENFTRFVQTKMQLLQAKALAMQWGWDPREFEAIDNKLSELFDIDPDHIMLKSNADKFKDQLAEVSKAVMQIWQENPLSKIEENAPTNQQTVPQPMWMQGESGSNLPVQPNDIQEQWGQTRSIPNPLNRLS